MFLRVSLVFVLLCPLGAISASADDGLCRAVSNPSRAEKPNDTDTVCGCARDYLKHVAQLISAIRTQANQLVAKGLPQNEIDSTYFNKGGLADLDRFVDVEYHDSFPRQTMHTWNDLLGGYLDGRGSLACTQLPLENSKLAELQKEKETLEQDQAKARAGIDATVAERKEGFAKEEDALHGLTEALKNSHDPAERARRMQEFREQQTMFARQRAQNMRLIAPNPGASFRISNIQRQIDSYSGEIARLKPGTYQELEFAIEHLWHLQVALAKDQLRIIQRDEGNAERDLNRTYNQHTDEIGSRWLAVWTEQLKAQQTSHKVKDETGWANEMSALCRSHDSLLESELNDTVRAMQAIAGPLKDARDLLGRQIQLWQRFAARDGWPAGGTKDIGFGQFAQSLFEPEPRFFLAVQDSKPQNRPGAPKTSEEANCLMCDLSAESPTIAAYWNQHPECQRFNGQMPPSVRLLQGPTDDAPVEDPSKLGPFGSSRSYLELNPFENVAFVDRKTVPGAADHDQP